MAPLRYAAKFDPFLSLDCAPTPSTLAQSKERKGSNFAIWQHWCQEVYTPLSSNTLMPTVTVGEAVRLLMPVSNDFQATLLLKKAKLLWKFLPDEQSDHVTNDGKDVDQEEASKFVKTEVHVKNINI